MQDMLVRMKKGKTTYEVIVQEGMVNKFRDGTVDRLDDVVTTQTVWLNAHKGQKASAEQLKASFETDDVQAVLDVILRKGEAQESAAERKEKHDVKRQEIITTIQKNYVAPDGRPLPVVRIENALTQLKPRIDVDVDASRQVSAMVPKLTAIMPMKKSAGGMEGTVSVPTHLAGAVSSAIRKHATVHREVYGDQAKFDVEIHAYEMLMKDLARVTKGQFDFSLNSQPPPEIGAASASGASGSKGGKKKGRGKNK